MQFTSTEASIFHYVCTVWLLFYKSTLCGEILHYQLGIRMRMMCLALVLTFNHSANELLQVTTMLYDLMYLTYGSAMEHEYLIKVHNRL